MRSLASFVLTLSAAMAAENSFLIRNATVYPVSGPRMENASVLVIEGKIAEVGLKITPPKAKVRIIEGKGLSVYPGLIDAGTVVGIAEVGSVRETQDTGELGQFNPQLRPLIAVNTESEHIPVTRANGITTVALLPATSGGRAGGGAIIGGQVSLARLNGWTWEEMEVKRGAALHLAYPAISAVSFDPETFRVVRGDYAAARRQRDQQVQQLEQFFEDARRYQAAKKAGTADFKTDLKLEAMLPVLDGSLPVVILATREREIREAVSFADRQKIRIVLAGVRRPGAMVEELAKKKIPVILGSPFTSYLEEDDPYDATFTVAAELHKAGVKLAFASFGAQFARNLPYQAGRSIAFGLPSEEGLRAVTLNAAEIFGVADQIGSIEKGKWADLMVTDGDPLEIRTQVKMLFVKGEAVDLETKHTRLYKKYLARP